MLKAYWRSPIIPVSDSQEDDSPCIPRVPENAMGAQELVLVKHPGQDSLQPLRVYHRSDAALGVTKMTGSGVAA